MRHTSLGFALFAGTPAPVTLAAAREAESLGYASFWLNYPGPIDGLAALGPVARQTARIELGVGVIPLHTRGPASIADGVAAAALPPARLLLGVGSPNPGSLARVREGVAALRARLALRVVVAALGPKMCHLAGEVADGVLLNWLTPGHAARSTEWIRAGAAAAGRPMPRVMAYVRLALGPGGAERLRDEGSRYASFPMYAAHFERMGVDPLVTAVAAPAAAAVAPALAPWHGVVDDLILRAVTARDTLDETLALVRAGRPAS
jgi:alkanesulfonate monooxygenase SsuD/methylene tetrahydromethanopterin reductase-like flavin-dependent oxidoreductase (luciferase family)